MCEKATVTETGVTAGLGGGVCPVCGHCKHCGHSPRPAPIVPWPNPYPIFPTVPVVPYTPWWYTTTGGFVDDGEHCIQNTAGGPVDDNAARLHTSGFAQAVGSEVGAKRCQ